ncbi:putative PAS/PAC sensor protein [Minicystis rosea]|nr:putative PAS/PAC sensor protein [Minicystis rosea]
MNSRSLDLAFQNDNRGLFLAGTRALAYTHVAVDMMRKQLVHQLGEDLARAIVAQAGRQGGFNDAQVQLQERQFDDLRAMLEMQYHLLDASGFGKFDVMDLEVDPKSGEAYVRVRCAGSPEAESHRRLFGASTLPACWHLVGYSTGWLSAMTNMRLLTIESRCVAKGDPHCELESLRYDDFVGPEAAFWKRAFESSSTSLAQELEEKLATIQRQMETISAQRSTIAELSTPILQVSSDLLVLPVIGNVDNARARAIRERLLNRVRNQDVRGVILDVTGVEMMDAGTASHLVRVAAAVKVLGSEIVVTGISAIVADVLVQEGIELSELVTLRTLQEGILYFSRRRRVD